MFTSPLVVASEGAVLPLCFRYHYGEEMSHSTTWILGWKYWSRNYSCHLVLLVAMFMSCWYMYHGQSWLQNLLPSLSIL